MKIGFDIPAFVRQYLPPILRTPVRVAWLSSLTAALEKIWADYDRFRTEARYAAAVTGQKIVLEAYLNRLFDPEMRRIRITYGQDAGLWVDYNADSDGGDEYLYDGVAVGSKEQGAADESEDFTVEIPAGTDPEAVRSIVNKYAIIGVTFNITTV